MIINLTKSLFNGRCSRTVIGRSSSSDISDIFEVETRDVISNEIITHENFDEDDVFYINNVGYTRRKELLKIGYTKLTCDSKYEIIEEKQFS